MRFGFVLNMPAGSLRSYQEDSAACTAGVASERGASAAQGCIKMGCRARETKGETRAVHARQVVEMIERVHEDAKACAQVAMAQAFAQHRAARGVRVAGATCGGPGVRFVARALRAVFAGSGHWGYTTPSFASYS